MFNKDIPTFTTKTKFYPTETKFYPVKFYPRCSYDGIEIGEEHITVVGEVIERSDDLSKL